MRGHGGDPCTRASRVGSPWSGVVFAIACHVMLPGFCASAGHLCLSILCVFLVLLQAVCLHVYCVERLPSLLTVTCHV